VTKSEVIDRLAEKFPAIQIRDVKSAVEIMLEHITQTLISGGRIEIRGFGSFSLHYNSPYLGRNPKTGEKIMLPDKYHVHFRPGKELRERVNNKQG
jgi:integration host factor subunit beta